MPDSRTCPQCQQPLSADAPDGLCPQCLMKAAAGSAPSAAGDGLPGDIIDIGDSAEVAKKLPQFEILEMLGRGGMGVVYKARQPQLDRLVALKILPPLDALSPDFVARFTREARALAKLNHPNIVNVHDFGETGGLYYIVMEYVDGANLRQLLEARKLTSAEALAIVPKICDALEYAHEEGLVHRDIKPENLLIDKKGRVKIADFGLAKLLRREPLDMTLTLSGMALGTLRYMAPEQMDKPETVDHRADLYSLGVVIYEMLTGETPVGRFELPSQKAQVDVRLDQIVLHALEKEPARRYQHASEVRDDVEKVTSKPAIAPSPILPSVVGAAALAAPVQAREARLSRLALWGALWTPLFFVTALFYFSFRVEIQRPDPGLAGHALDYPAPSDPEWWQLALRFTLLPLGVLAPFGTTLLGTVAIAQIKRSNGKLYGLRLAAADALLFPLIVVFLLVGVIAFFALDGRDAVSVGPVVAVCFFAGLAVSSAAGWFAWWSIVRGNEIEPRTRNASRTQQKSRIAAWLLGFSLLGLAGCLWPYSVQVAQSFTGGSEGESNRNGVIVDEVAANSPAGKAGITAGDGLRSLGGRPVHLNGSDGPDEIWSQISVGTDVEIKLERNNQEIVLHALRSPDPIGPRCSAQWQFIAGISFLLFAVFLLLAPSFPSATRWRGLAASLLGLATLIFMLAFAPTYPERAVWKETPPGAISRRFDYGQKLAVGAAALALLLLGAYDTRRVFGQSTPELKSP
jgi:serine/threonine protein kinase